MSHHRELLNPPELHPAPGFSHVAIAEGAKVVHFAGQVAIAPDFSLVAEDLHGQTAAAMQNLKVAMDAAGVGWDDIVRRTIYTTAADRVRDDHEGDRRGHGRRRPSRPDDRRHHRPGRAGTADRDRVHGGALLTYDAVVVGSGINSLACAALLSRGGWSVAVLEREDELGGAIRTAELTEPGYLHDVFSAWHPLWVGGAAHAELGDELAAHGLEYLNTEFPTASAFPDGSSAFLLRSAEANAEELDRHAEGDGEAWGRMLGEFFPNADLAFGVLGTELWSRAGLGLGAEGLSTARPPGGRRIRRPGAQLEPRLAPGDVPVGAGARPPRAVGAPHRPRPRCGRLGLHDAGDRRRGPGGRDADPARRRREARRGADGPDPGERRGLRDGARRREGARP